MALLAGKRPTVASVIAVAALVCAMSGTAVAGSTALHNGNKLIAKHTLSGNRLRGHTVTSAQLKQPVWHALTLQNGWAAFDSATYGAPAYAVDSLGFVHLRGAIKGDSSTSDTFTQLPAGIVPVEPNDFVPAASTNGPSGPEPVVLDIQHAGFITVQDPPAGSKAFISLAGVTFSTG